MENRLLGFTTKVLENEMRTHFSLTNEPFIKIAAKNGFTENGRERITFYKVCKLSNGGFNFDFVAQNYYLHNEQYDGVYCFLSLRKTAKVIMEHHKKRLKNFY